MNGFNSVFKLTNPKIQKYKQIHPQMQTIQNLHEMQVHSCTFETHIASATMSIKFPCTYSVQLKSMNNKINIASTKGRVSAINSVAVFDQTLKFETELLYHPKNRQYVRKDILLLLNLVSQRKPDQQKLVGRVVVDLGQAVQNGAYATGREYKLDYCSVSASVNFTIKFMGKKISNTAPENFDRDSFSDFQSFVAGIGGNKQGSNNNSSKQRSFEESTEKAEIFWKGKTIQGFNRNNIIEESHNQDAESRINTGRTSHKIIESESNQNLNLITKNITHENEMTVIPKLQLSQASSIPHPSPHLLQQAHSPGKSSNPDSAIIADLQLLSRVRSDIGARKQSQQNFHHPVPQPSTTSQYEEILRSSHAQERKIWDEEKRLLNEQIFREKQENAKQKDRNQGLEKKLYESELKLSNIEGKIENSKREMVILERQKDLQIKDLKSKIQRALRQKSEKSQHLELRQSQLRQVRQKLRAEQNQKRRSQQQLNKEQNKMHEKVEVALKRVMSSEELVSKLQKERKQASDSLGELERRNLELQGVNNQLRTKIQGFKEVEMEVNRVRSENQQLEKKFKEQSNRLTVNFEEEKSKLVTKLKNQSEQQKKNLQNRLISIQNKYRQQISLFQQIRTQQTQQSVFLKQRITQLEAQLSEIQIRQNSLFMEIEAKDKQISRITQECNHKLAENQGREKERQKETREEAGRLNVRIEELESINSSLEAKIIQIQLTVKRKDQEISMLTNNLQQLQSTTKQTSTETKQYIQNLQKQILSLSESLSEKQPLLLQQSQIIQTLKNTINEMKDYEKGLEQELLSMHDGNGNREEEYRGLLEEKMRYIGDLEKFRGEATERMQELENAVTSYNKTLAQRNSQIQKLSTEKNQTKQYILSLQTELLKASQEAQKNITSNNHLKTLQTQIISLKQQNKEKDMELDRLKMTNLQMKEYQIGIEEQILKMGEEIEEMGRKNGRVEVTSVNGEVEKQALAYKQQILKLQRRIKQLEKTLEQKKIYQSQLQQKILSDNNKEPISLTRQNQLLKKIHQLEDIIKCLKQYQEGLEQKILLDHKEIEYTNSNNVLVQKIRGQEETIKHLREYQEGLEEKILADHDEIEKEGELKKSIGKLEAQIAQQREYQEGLEQKILADHQEIRKQHQLKQSIQLLQAKIQQQKQYQQGLQQKILQDHQILDKLDSHTNGLKQSLKLPSTHLNGVNLHEECQRERNKLEYIIQGLERDLFRLTESSPIKDGNGDGEILELKKQVQEKERYVQELEVTLKETEKEMIIMSEHMSQLIAYKQENQRRRQEQQQARQQEQELKAMALNTVIRIMEVHSDEQQNQQGGRTYKRGSIEKSIISQPPSIRDGQQMFEQGSNPSSPGKPLKKSQDIPFSGDRADEIVMNIDDVDKKPEKRGIVQKSNSVGNTLKNESKGNMLSLYGREVKEQITIPAKDLQKDKQLQQFKQKIATLQTTLKNIQVQKQKLATTHKETESKLAQTDSQNKFYRKRIQQLQIKVKNQPQPQPQLQLQAQIAQKSSQNQIKQLKSILQQYENRIRMMKNKEIKIQQTLVIIEEESHKIVSELGLRDRECEELRVLLNGKNREIEEMNAKMMTVPEQPEAREASDQSKDNTLQKLTSLMAQNSQKQQQLLFLKQKLSIQSDSTQKYQQLLAQMAQIQQTNKCKQKQYEESKSKISRLELQLQAVNEQLLTSKRLVTKLRENKEGKNSSILGKGQGMGQGDGGALVEENKELKKRVEELEEELFSYQAGENQKDIQMEGLKNEIVMLRNEIEKIKSLGQNSTKQPTQSQNSQELTKKISQILQLKSTLQKQTSLNNQLKSTLQKQAALNTQITTKLQQIQQRLKSHQTQITKLQSLMKAQRLEYFSKRRELTQQKQEADKVITENNGRLQQKEIEINELKSIYEQTKVRIMELEEVNCALEEERQFLLTNMTQMKEKAEAEIKNQNNSSNESLALKEMQNELNFYSEQLAIVTKKWEELEPLYNIQRQKLELAQRTVQQLSQQLQICQQQNEFAQQKLKKNIQLENKQEQKAYQQKIAQCNDLTRRISQLTQELNRMKTTYQNSQKVNSEKILQLEEKYKMAESQRQKAIQELEEKQMQHMNTELDLQFKLREKNQKSQLAIGSSCENPYRKSLNASQQQAVATVNDIIPASKILKELLTNRTNRGLAEKQIQVMVIRITQLQQQLFGNSAATKEKGLILEKTRLMSMEFSKLKVSVMKSKMVPEERIKFLSSLRPLENSIKDILKLSEIYSENLLSSQLTGENVSRN